MLRRGEEGFYYHMAKEVKKILEDHMVPRDKYYTYLSFFLDLSSATFQDRVVLAFLKLTGMTVEEFEKYRRMCQRDLQII